MIDKQKRMSKGIFTDKTDDGGHKGARVSKDQGIPRENPLAASISRHVLDENPKTLIPSLSLHRRYEPMDIIELDMPPSICLIGQGVKNVTLGDEYCVYDTGHLLVTSVDLPITGGRVLEASPERPFLSLTLNLDLRLLSELILEAPPSARPSKGLRLGVAVTRLTPQLLGAFLRLLDLLDSPRDIPALAPLVTKEILYRLLMGKNGPQLRQIASMDGDIGGIVKVIGWLKKHFRERLLIGDITARFGISESSLYQHFKSITSLSPIQYQKRLRLVEAKRLILVGGLQVADAAFKVGYGSPSQFSRDYSKLFGLPPGQDLKRFRAQSEGLRSGTA
ncbi:MAG: AraC family transcriptional regulator [Deltaproteobacteria bacterium]|jgi:AraC-like DNA-binding protein|nr:AraC family transcriptional regulator [Deltaproteobacteria bacterium]